MTKPSSTHDAIRLRGVRQNNLKNFDLDLPIHKLTVITGLSGSGKSSLAFDTLFAEGQRRYIETFSPYARQFFDRMDKPQVDRIEGIPPAIAIEQRNSVRSTRSTVGTMTELCDYMKLLWPHVAKLHCRQCGRTVSQEPPQVIWERLALQSEKAAGVDRPDLLVTFNLPLSEKLSLADSLALIVKQGYQRLLIGTEIVRIEEAAARWGHKPPAMIVVVQDRLKLLKTNRARFVEAAEQAYHFGKGRLTVHTLAPGGAASTPVIHESSSFSRGLHCAACDLDYREPSPALFSFNHPVGACPTCKGFGRVISIDYNIAIPDRSKTLAGGAVKPWQTGMSADCQRDLMKFCRASDIATDVPFEKLSQRTQDWVIDGDAGYDSDDPEHSWPRAWYGVKGYFRWLESKSYKMHVRVLLSRYRAYTPCPECRGKRLKPEALLYQLDVPASGSPEESGLLSPTLPSSEEERESEGGITGRNARTRSRGITPLPSQSISLADFYSLSIERALALVEQLAQLHSHSLNDPIGLALNEVRARLRYLAEVGLGYLTLDRPTRTLSGGETERVNLTTCLGTRLVNTLFVLDEPSVGLHPRDTARLVHILQQLRDAGNTVVVVEHEASVMRAADNIVDLGPGQGDKGGQIVFHGPLQQLLTSERSLTGQYLSGRKRIEVPARRPVRLEEVSRVPRELARLRLATDGQAVTNGIGASAQLNEATVPYEAKPDPSAITEPEEKGLLSPTLSSSEEERESNAGVTGRNARTQSRGISPALRIINATRHNLSNLTIEIPLGRFVALTGVSGSGKTTLVREVLLPALQAQLAGRRPGAGGSPAVVKASDRMEANTEETEDGAEDAPSVPGASRFTLEGCEHLQQVVLVDQTPLGKTPRSNPVVYIGAFDDVRELFAQSDLARQRGLNASAFSFNSAVGQCERCRGAGFEKIEMQFLSDIFIRCPECNGRRYRGHILEVKLRADGRQWSVADMLEATVDEALDFLVNYIHLPAGRRAIGRLKFLKDVGLSYLRLGQPINTLSGGESQRLKLVSHLAEAESEITNQETAGNEMWEGAPTARRSSTLPVGPVRIETEPESDSPTSRPHTLFLFDEPTTGLHFDDVRVLLQVFQKLVDAGNSVLVIEHNLDVVRSADWVIDLGPEAGERGGQLVVAGTPEEVAACKASHTGRFLRETNWTGSEGVRERRTGSGGVRERGSEGERLGHPPTPSLPHPPTPPLPGSPTPTASPASIALHGAREHNLKNLSLEIPRGKFVVLTGVSGSGKSTLAFDLIFAEGQRRFLDSMNTYARQFVEQLSRPDVDRITGLPPTVSIEQRTTRGGGKSTVATVTEVYHFFRLLFARLGTQYCPDCQLPVEAQTRDALAAGLQRERRKRGELVLLAPVVRNRKGFHSDVADWAAKHGYREIRADGKFHDSRKPFRLDRFKEHDVEIVVGVLGQKGARSSRVRPDPRYSTSASDARAPQQLIDDTLKLGRGTLFALDSRGTLTIHSTERACPKCSRSFSPLDPKDFSYNSAQGWCPKCRGFGELFYLPEVERGANADAVEESWWSWADERETCPECHGARLKPESRAVRLAVARTVGTQKPIAPAIGDFSTLAVRQACELFRKLKFKGREAAIARDILPEIVERLNFLEEVGLGYVQLGRAVPTLSGGEAQRIRLAAQLGSNLSGVLYVLDEPTIGLHARDNEQLLAALQKLQARGNSLIVVEHDEETMRRADYVVDLGPGAGVHGGEVVAAGTLAELMDHEDSITGQCLRAQAVKRYPTRGERRKVESLGREGVRKWGSGKRVKSAHSPAHPPSRFLTLRGASTHNLKDLTLHVPLGRFVVVTGVSGSGKSTLVRECLLPAVEAALKPRSSRSEARKDLELTGYESLKAVYEVDQSPIGRTPRSIPATYVGFFDHIRALFAQMPEARMRGYTASRFSFNSAQGRCPECEGAGLIKLEMNFLPPAFVRCETCGGSRFGRETLDIQFGGKNIAQVLDMSVEEAIGFFAAQQKILRPLQALHDTGLDYLKLGQTSPTLSGGEAQRVKLVTHLLSGLKPSPQSELIRDFRDDARPRSNLFILEEPTIGLHMSDVRRLVEVLQRLVDSGHSVIVIEHNLDFIAEADWVIDLGPEGGAAGGRLVVEGTPEQVTRAKGSHTGRFLRQMLKR